METETETETERKKKKKKKKKGWEWMEAWRRVEGGWRGVERGGNRIDWSTTLTQ